jgi:integrase
VARGGNPRSLSNVTAGWRRILERAKLPGFRLYDLRRIVATELLAQGTRVTYVAR